MKLINWIEGEPPLGYELGPVPTDYGVGRAAYKWRWAELDEDSPFSDGRVLEDIIYRGDWLIQHSDGSIERLERFTGVPVGRVVELLKELAYDERKGNRLVIDD